MVWLNGYRRTCATCVGMCLLEVESDVVEGPVLILDASGRPERSVVHLPFQRSSASLSLSRLCKVEPDLQRKEKKR